ncbi:P-loop containing nucleoside triphosphate hydrolase protein [Obelidium mucronatum]|nr:P-loop containing nucleoside triphosphate hydrolase protein [Obelidium mucronatum]
MKPGRNVSATKTNSSFGGRQFQADLGPDLSMHSLENNTDESLVNTASITSTLALRLSKGIMYTRIGTRVMVVLNPCRDLENVEGVIHQRVSEFRGDAASQSSAQLDGSPLSSLNPHLLETVENAYIHLIQEKKDQTILLLGKSGSGKSRTHSLLIDHLLALSSPLPKLAARIRLLSPLFPLLGGFEARRLCRAPVFLARRIRRRQSRFGFV